MPAIPKPRSKVAAKALRTIGAFMAAKRHSAVQMDSETKEAYRTWGKITGTHLRPGHRHGLSVKAAAFAEKTPPPAGENLTLGFDQFHAKKTGKSWQSPYLRFSAPAFVIDYTLAAKTPKWRIRFTGRTQGRAATTQKLALLQHFQIAELPHPVKGRLTNWHPIPGKFLEVAPSYVRKFLKALGTPETPPVPNP